MVFRKPYAFFIKYFKLFHIIMTIITVYMIYKSTAILSFINDYVANSTNVIGQSIVETIYSPLIFIDGFLAIIMATVVLIVMKVKEKPIAFYVYNVGVYIASFILFIVGQQILGTMEIEIVDIRIVKLMKDLFTGMVFLQFVSMCLTAVRATGFDVKKFDFVKDLQELNVDEKDNEEFEVDVELDTDRYRRIINKRIRHAKYVYIENKFLINVLAILLVVGTIGTVIYVNRDKDKIYKEDSYFTASNFTLMVSDSYLTTKDYRGNKISDNYTMVILKVHVKNNFDSVSNLENARMELSAGGHYFYPTTKYADSVIDLGTNYESYDITNEESVYVLVYEVPNHLTKDTMYYRYAEQTGRSSKVRLNPINLDKKNNTKGTVGKTVTVQNGLLKGTKIVLSEPEIKDSFELNYRFCVTSTECYDSTDYITPSLNENYDKTILRINLKTQFSEQYLNDQVSSNSDLIATFGIIKYKVENNNQVKEVRPTVKNVRNDSNKNHVYLEVNSEIKQATEIYLELQIRDQTISYKLK